jgi:hypothetical protein
MSHYSKEDLLRQSILDDFDVKKLGGWEAWNLESYKSGKPKKLSLYSPSFLAS